jgi:putative transposase
MLRAITRLGYETDLTDEQWEFIAPRFKELVGNYGNRAEWPKRELVNGVLYLVKTGCQWKLLPKDFPPYSTVHTFYRRARLCGLWQVIMDDLVALSRLAAEREPSPTYALIDSQSSKTTSASEERGIDGGKKRKAGSVIL